MRQLVFPIQCTTATQSQCVSLQASQSLLLKLPFANGCMGVSVNSCDSFLAFLIREYWGSSMLVERGGQQAQSSLALSSEACRRAAQLGLCALSSIWGLLLSLSFLTGQHAVATARVSMPSTTQAQSSTWILNSRVHLQIALSDDMKN